MKQYIYCICIFFLCSFAEGSTCLSNAEAEKKLSSENIDNFKITVKRTKDDTMAITISAPRKIYGKKLKRVSAYGENIHGKVTYFFPVDTVLRKNRFESGYEIDSDLVDGSYIQFSYGECGAVFTYPVIVNE